MSDQPRIFTRDELLALAGQDDTRCCRCARKLATRKDRARHMVETDSDFPEERYPCPLIKARISADQRDHWCQDLCWSEFYCEKKLCPEVALFALSLLEKKGKV